VTMSEAKSVAATFTLQRFALTVTKEGIGRGTVTSSSDPASSTQIDCGTTCWASYDWGTVVTLTATPGFANLFFGWSGCDEASGTTCTVTMRAAGTVTATFRGLPIDVPPPPRFRFPMLKLRLNSVRHP
jgi:List-Bact-rpt repeat protein